MTNNDLYIKLKESYTGANLNNITANIIGLYKAKQFGSIRKISRIVSEYTFIEDHNISKCFSKLIMIYHPDKEAFYNQELDKLFHSKNFDSLNQYAHILVINDIDKFDSNDYEVDEDIDYSPEYIWDYDKEGFEYFDSDEEAQSFEEGPDYFAEDNNFFNAVKRKVYGSMKVDLPSYYLEDFEDIEMAEYEIESLEGIEFCIHAVNIDLSKNLIEDISALWDLTRIEELYLANNQIGLIDALSNLKELRVLDISYNYIDDLSPLFELENLEYVNAMGNKIPQSQIDFFLRKKEMVFVF
jgi:Leucine-rich repeat (LRR) protein